MYDHEVLVNDGHTNYRINCIHVYTVNDGHIGMYIFTHIYRGTSNSGPSEIGTQYIRLLYKGHWPGRGPKIISFFERGQPRYKGQNMQLNLYCPQRVLYSEVPL